jgi:hypothetical protein
MSLIAYINNITDIEILDSQKECQIKPQIYT